MQLSIVAIFSLQRTDAGVGLFGNPREFRCTGEEIVQLGALCDGIDQCGFGVDERSFICESKLYPNSCTIPNKRACAYVPIIFKAEDSALHEYMIVYMHAHIILDLCMESCIRIAAYSVVSIDSRVDYYLCC